MLRREFFARAGSLATRYGVTPERLVSFCSQRDPSTPLGTSRLVGHIEDLVMAAACTDDVAPAWSDLHERHESILVRATSERFGADDALLFVRRWLAALRRSTLAQAGALAGGSSEAGAGHDPVLHADHLRAPSIADYPGQQPLRHWLAQRLDAELARHPHLPPGRRLRLTPSRFGVGFPSSAGI